MRFLGNHVGSDEIKERLVTLFPLPLPSVFLSNELSLFIESERDFFARVRWPFPSFQEYIRGLKYMG